MGRPETVVKGTSRSGDFFRAGSRTSDCQRWRSDSALTLFMGGHYSPLNSAVHEPGPGRAAGAAHGQICRSLYVVLVSYYVPPIQGGQAPARIGLAAFK